ncbi:MAG: DMT family transporter [Pseudomonadota bacterium]
MKGGRQSAETGAAFLMIAGMTIIGVVDNYVVRIAELVGLWQFHFIRSLVALPLIGLIAALGAGSLRMLRPGAVALRSLLVAIAMLFYFSAAALMPLAQALAGLFTSPIFVLLLTVAFTGQRIGPRRILAVACGFAGIIFVLQPDPNDFDLTILVPVAGGMFYAMGAIVTRSMCAREDTLAMLAAMVLSLGLMGAVGLAILSVFSPDPAAGPDGFVTRGWVWPIWPIFPLIVMQAVGTTVAVYMLIKAYQIGEPSRVAVFEYSVMVSGPLYAWVVMGQPLGLWQVLGIGLIILAGCIIAIRSAQIEESVSA